MLNSINYAFQVSMKSDGKTTKELVVWRNVVVKSLFESHKRKLVDVIFNILTFNA